MASLCYFQQFLFPLIIPCHRVIRNDGKMGGFTAYGGTQLKYRMLKLEKTQP
ncbi:MAG: MGMT family protein [Phycisphaerae bacterium]